MRSLVLNPELPLRWISVGRTQTLLDRNGFPPIDGKASHAVWRSCRPLTLLASALERSAVQHRLPEGIKWDHGYVEHLRGM